MTLIHTLFGARVRACVHSCWLLERASADALVGMTVVDEDVGRGASVAHARTVHRSQLRRHTLCTAAAPHPSLQSSVGLQLEKVAVNCNAAEKALLANLTEAHPDASYIDLLRLFKVRRSVADGHSWRAWRICACFALPAHLLLAAAAPDPLFGSTLFVFL